VSKPANCCLIIELISSARTAIWLSSCRLKFESGQVKFEGPNYRFQSYLIYHLPTSAFILC
jgi:hypothetical protein